MIGERLGHYQIERRIGAGGMGMVYAARDTRLGRPVALKVIHEGLDDADMRERLWREARAAAALNHSSVCQVYDVGESEGRLFVVMELLDGETLADRLAYGPMEGAEVVRIGLALLDGLAALHRLGIVHRDIKPSNVFLLSDRRVKLLDFGLVRVAPGFEPVQTGAPASSGSITRPGFGIGSPGYMPPEQAAGDAVDARSDLYSLGVVLYEAATGRRAFQGANAIELMHAAMHGDPPPIRGSAWLEHLNGVLMRAMARRAEARYANALEMASALRAIEGGSPVAASPAFARLAVLPFRMLRPDPDRDFLAPSLADSIAMSLAGIRSLVVRSTVTSARFATEPVDLEALARALDVDAVLTGTLLVAGSRCRVAAQLIEAPSGNVRWSETLDVSSEDIFELQDSITRHIVESLKLPLTAHEQGALERNVPANKAAFELFLRANQLCSPEGQPAMARDLYMRALEVDPSYAPAWVRLGTCHRLLGKYFPGDSTASYRRAQEALSRAFELRPDFPAAALARAQIELDLGHTEAALEYLLGVVERNPNDPAGFSGLVTALRYAGFLDASRAAHRRAVELDPEAKTSHLYTSIAAGDLETARAATEPYPRAIGLMHAGDIAGAAKALEWDTNSGGNLLRSHLEGRTRDLEAQIDLVTRFPDPEGIYVSAMFVAVVATREQALDLLARAVRGGFFCGAALELPFFRPMAGMPLMEELRRETAARHAAAAERYGERIAALGLG